MVLPLREPANLIELETNSDVNEALWEGGQGGEGLILVRVGRYPQAWLAAETQKIIINLIPFSTFHFFWAGLGSVGITATGI